MKFKYSIIIPVYNTKIEVFEKCLKSIAESNNFDKYKDIIEVVIINDGSFIKYESLIDKYSKLMSINYIDFNVNQGQYEARLTGFEKSQGDFILGLDSDDEYSPQIFDKLEEWITKYDGSRVYYWLTEEDRKMLLSDSQKYVLTPGKGVWNSSEIWNLVFNSYQRYIQGYLVTKCIPRELMMESVRILRQLNLGRVNLFDDQILTNMVMYILYKHGGTLEVHHDGMYVYNDHHTDVRFKDPSEQDMVDEFNRKSILRKQLARVWDYIFKNSCRLIDRYVMTRESILGTICKIHAVDFTKGFYDMLVKEFGYFMIYVYNKYNGRPFKRFILDE